MQCPDCSGPMWDNRETKRSPKQPDWKCKDKDGCGKGVWDQPRGGGRGNGGGSPRTAPERPTGPLAPVYGECVEIAARAIVHYCKAVGVTPGAADIVAGAATIFIAATNTGRTIKGGAPKPKPAPPPPPPEPEPDEDPYQDDRDLPF